MSMDFKLDEQLNVIEITEDYKSIPGAGKDPSIWSRQPKGGAWDKGYKNGILGAGWIERWDFPDFQFVQRLAIGVSKLTGKEWIPVDHGGNRSPQFDIIRRPEVGDDASKGFNGDYYPVGKVISVSGGPQFRLVVVDGPQGKLKFYRRGPSASWVQSGGTWSLLRGVVDERNREF
jgi:hypothetical protein